MSFAFLLLVDRNDVVGNIVKERGQGKVAAGGTLSFGGEEITCPSGGTLTLDETDLTACYDTSYEYDRLGQLTRVNDQREQATWTFHYDKGGNSQEKKRYTYTTDADLSSFTPEETIPYAYDELNWKDKLTAYDGKAITYDEIGNPLTYDGWAYTWKAGRMLHSMENGSINAQFTYDHTGLRVKKSVNGVDTLYTMNGKKITNVEKGNTHMHFFYDAQGRPAIVQYNDVDYTYLHNLQGDVTGIVDMNGALVVQYTYDAWGKLLATEGSMAATLGVDNPFRYRGYVYDEETGLYVTPTRYYNPEWGRWLNADNIAVAVKLGAKKIHGLNLYAYCFNRPTNMSDNSGHWPKWVIDSANWIAQAAIDVGDWTVQAAIDVGDWTVQAAVDVGDWTVQAVTDVGNGIHKTFDTLGRAALFNAEVELQWSINNAKWMAQAATDAWNWTRQAVTDTSKFLIQTTGGQIITNLVSGAWGTFKLAESLGVVVAATAAVPLSGAASLPVATGYAAKASYHNASAGRSFGKAIQLILRLIFGGKK